MGCPTQRASDCWESARFQAVCVAWSWFRQNGVVSSHPPDRACRDHQPPAGMLRDG